MIRQSSLMAPYIKHPATTRGIMLDVMLCMAALYLIAAFYYGGRAIMLGLVSMAVCMLCEWLGSLLRLERHNPHDISALVTGMMIPLMLPAGVPYYIVIVADCFAILLVKYAFGGTGYNLFNPAAGGVGGAGRVCSVTGTSLDTGWRHTGQQASSETGLPSFFSS